MGVASWSAFAPGWSAIAYGPVRWLRRDRRSDALDQLIAAHALALRVTLVTNNPSDFQACPGLCLEHRVAQSNDP